MTDCLRENEVKRCCLTFCCLAALALMGGLIWWSLAPVSGDLPIPAEQESDEAAASEEKPVRRERRVVASRQEVRVEADVVASSSAENLPHDEPEEESSSDDSEPPEIRGWNNAISSVTALQEEGRRPSASDVRKFKAAFDAFSAEQKRDNINEALNLFTDESIDCLTAILYDSSEPLEILNDVFNDIMNRPDEIRGKVFQHIVSGPKHPLVDEVRDILSRLE